MAQLWTSSPKMLCAGVGAGRNVASADAVLDLLASAAPKQTDRIIDPVPLSDLTERMKANSSGEHSGRAASAESSPLELLSDLSAESARRESSGSLAGDSVGSFGISTALRPEPEQQLPSWSEGAEENAGQSNGSESSDSEQLRQEARDLLLTTLREQT